MGRHYDTYPVLPGFKRHGTSEEAAHSMIPELSFLRGECLKAIAALDSTADEVATVVGRTVLAIRPRITELNKLELIYDSGLRRKNDSGRNAIVWRWSGIAVPVNIEEKEEVRRKRNGQT